MSTRTHLPPKTRLKGLSLIEMMISLAIGLMITAAIGYLYVNSQQSYRQQDSLARTQENGRFALDVISQDIRMAGYWGCAGAGIPAPINTLDTPTSYLFNFGVAIEGHEATGTNAWTPAKDASITNAVSGTDIVTLRGTYGSGTTVIQHPGGSPPGSADLKVTEDASLAQGDIVIVSDCQAAAVFQITHENPSAGFKNLVHNTGAFTPGPGNFTKALGKEYTGGEILKAATKSYYIRLNTAGRPALYRMFNGTAEELVENVENLQLTYGIDTNGDRAVDSYAKANAVTDWKQVRTVRVRLLLVSPDDRVSATAQTYAYVDTDADGIPDPVTAGDQRLRYVFTSTIGIRNRLP